MPAVRVDQLVKRFDQTVAVAWVDLDVRAGELFTLLGPSGCGKTTLLRLLAGLEQPDEGAIFFGNRRVDREPAHLRNIGLVFQNYALFPHMTVAENVAYGLKARKVEPAEVGRRVEEALVTVQMERFGARSPGRLSGGQQQRVALARALATRPDVLLLDEPLSNLDARLRIAMRSEIRRLQRQVGITAIYVTHDQEEALAISDRIGVMEGGSLLQVGTPGEIYRSPASREVAGFVGTCSFLEGELLQGEVSVLGERFSRDMIRRFSGPVWIGLRPESLRLLPPTWEPPGEVVLPGWVVEESFAGSFCMVRCRLTSGEQIDILSSQPPGTYPPSAHVAIALRPEAAMLFDRSSGGALT